MRWADEEIRVKIKRYQAADMRQALRMVKDAQGPEAVILSSRKVAGGVEVVAAVDYDEVSQPGARGGAVPAAAWRRSERAADDIPAESDDFALLARSFRGDGDAVGGGSRPAILPGATGAAEVAAGTCAAGTCEDDFGAGAAFDDRSAVNVNEELRSLRCMLETQLATLAWNDLSRRAPLQTELLKQLSELGIAHDLAGELVSQLPSRLELAELYRLALALMARRIHIAQERWMDCGGVIAMVGATGVGKTTLLAKLAARWVMRHGAREIALVTADSIRIGAQEQLHTLGRLLGVPAYGIESPSELPALLDQLAAKRLVLIDTAGFSQRDPRLASELAALAEAGERIETTLVLSAAAQAGAIEEAVQRFAAVRPASCVLTKLDEATSLGGVLSMLMRSALPLAYLSDGQQVPEDLHPARAHRLIARAVELSRSAGASADEDLLSRRFGTVAHALA